MNKKNLLFVLILSVFVGGTSASAHTLNPAFVEKITGEQVEDHYPATTEDPRFEERTFASFPEWYIVYNAQEYSRLILEGGRPSQFPYFASIGQYWDSVDYVKTALGSSTIDSNTNTVLRVIGASFTLENAVIGLYEKTVGFVFETLNLFYKTNEDRYTGAVAAEYGDFLLHTPWYQFPYGQKLVGLWTTYGWSSLTPRGIERRVAFTVGYALKGIYGTILGKLSQASLGNAQLNTSMTVENVSADSLKTIQGMTIEEDSGVQLHVTAPRYRAFTGIAEAISQKGGRFSDIQGNKIIMLSIIAEPSNECPSDLTVQFSMPLLTQPNLSRIALTTPVDELSNAIRKLNSCGIRLEHIYDY
jgi:hypothetical protein